MGDGVHGSLNILAYDIMYDVTNAIMTGIRGFCDDGELLVPFNIRTFIS